MRPSESSPRACERAEGARRLPTDLITLLAVGAWGVLFVGYFFGVQYTFAHISFWLVGVSYVAALYLSTLALRACYLTGPRVRRAWRNLILMAVLSAVGLMLVGLSEEHHQRFWMQHFPAVANAVRRG